MVNVADRRLVLETAARSEGCAWAAWWRSDLERQGRRRAGGWPGTLSEARRRAVGRIARELGREFAVTTVELERAAHDVYATAKRSWDQSSDPDDDPTSSP
jgi:hypothetical protein